MASSILGEVSGRINAWSYQKMHLERKKEVTGHSLQSTDRARHLRAQSPAIRDTELANSYVEGLADTHPCSVNLL